MLKLVNVHTASPNPINRNGLKFLTALWENPYVNPKCSAPLSILLERITHIGLFIILWNSNVSLNSNVGIEECKQNFEMFELDISYLKRLPVAWVNDLHYSIWQSVLTRIWDDIFLTCIDEK